MGQSRRTCPRAIPGRRRPSRTEDESHMESHRLASAIARSAERGTGVMELAALIEGLRASVAPRHIRELYTCWIEHHPDDPMLYAALYNYAVVLTDAGDLTQARACLERVLSL